MIVFPAIDLKEGRCVRLRRGDMTTAVVYGDDPVAMAQRWEAEGAEYLHVVDLDGAVEGRPMNAPAVQAICRAIKVPVQTGGGVRDADTVRRLLDSGARRVILGTVAYENPEMVASVCEESPGRIAVGIDARGEEAAGRGWTQGSGQRATDIAERVASMGVACVIYTDIARDGTGEGPNVESTRKMARALRATGVPLVASGGVGSLDHVERVAGLEAEGVAGLIVGRALYTGAVRLGDALRIASGRRVTGEAGMSSSDVRGRRKPRETEDA